MAEAENILDAATRRGLHMRLVGALAVVEKCPNHRRLLQQLDRRLMDLDFMGYERELAQIESMFEQLGYTVLAGGGVTMEAWVQRRIFEKSRGTGVHIDVFLDSLNFCHPIDLRSRLEMDPVTIPLADIFLQKLQIVDINEKDLKDLIVLFLEHPVGEGGLDVAYVIELLRGDWGFYYTVSLNLDRLRDYAHSLPALAPSQRDLLEVRIAEFRSRVEAAPKTLKWKLRARVGTSKRWYQKVDVGLREVPSATPAQFLSSEGSARGLVRSDDVLAPREEP